MNRNLLSVLAIVVVIILVGGFFYFRNSKTPAPQVANPTPTQEVSQATPTPQVSASPSASPSEVMKKEATVKLTATGFVPSTLNITAGTKVTWTNTSGTTGNVSSDPHPVHTNWPFLNLGSFTDGQSVSVTFDKAGTYTYHNHLEPSQKGTVIVK